MKKILSFILCLVSVFASGCNSTPEVVPPTDHIFVKYNVSKGYDADTIVSLSREGEVDENQLSFEAWEELYGKYRGLALMRVEVESSASYYTVNENGIAGGYTETILFVKESYSYSQIDLDKYPEGYFSKNSVIRLVELYTIDEKGELRKPTYRPVGMFSTTPEWKQENTNPILVDGREYIVMLNAKPIIGYYYYELNCYMDEVSSQSRYTIDETDPFASWMTAGTTALNSALSRFYEFSEEAYEASKAIVEEYEAEGKTMKDGPYYHYHGMVVESWERYSKSVNGETDT